MLQIMSERHVLHQGPLISNSNKTKSTDFVTTVTTIANQQLNPASYIENIQLQGNLLL